MTIDIIIAYVKRYEFGHEKDFVPPITGIHLAAITPREHTVRVFHQQVDRIDLDSPADLIALSFFSGFAPAAFDLATSGDGPVTVCPSYVTSPWPLIVVLPGMPKRSSELVPPV